DMLAGKYNPGQLQIVREILPGAGGFDTANFSGNRADYIIAIDNNGTPGNLSDDIVTVTDTVVGRDGSDRLTHMERLQFADQAVVFPAGVGLNAAPVGLLEIRDAATNTPDNTPTEGQLLRVSKDGVTDANNVSLTNPTGAVNSSVSYVWQVERDP